MGVRRRSLPHRHCWLGGVATTMAGFCLQCDIPYFFLPCPPLAPTTPFSACLPLISRPSCCPQPSTSPAHQPLLCIHTYMCLATPPQSQVTMHQAYMPHSAHPITPFSSHSHPSYPHTHTQTRVLIHKPPVPRAPTLTSLPPPHCPCVCHSLHSPHICPLIFSVI